MGVWGKIKESMTGAGVEGTVRDLGMASEQRTLDRVLEMVDLVVAITEKLHDVTKYYCADAYDAMDKVAAELDAMESSCDDMRRDILGGLYSSGFFPISRVDLLRLVNGLDHIANYATGAGDRIAMRRFELTPELNQLLEEMSETDLRAVRKLRDVILKMQPNMRDAMEESEEVDRIEGEVDDYYVRIYAILFEMDIDFKTFHQLKAIIERLEELADQAAYCAETIRLIAIRHLEIS
jgi:predicted phosphate transport protein (TIGR00153 family)